MPICLVRIVEPLLRLLYPAVGRHRSVAVARMPAPAPQPRVPALRGEDIGLVRPYLVAHERRQREHRLRQETQQRHVV